MRTSIGFIKAHRVYSDEQHKWFGDHEGREKRVAEHTARIQAVMPTVKKHRAFRGSGKAMAIWCPELQEKFESMSSAARFLGVYSSIIHDAVYRKESVNGFHFVPFDPSKHSQHRHKPSKGRHQ